MIENPIKALIVDDEPLVRERIFELLRIDPDFEVLDVATNGNEAIEQILRLNPDVIFLDIQMPDKNGFEVLEKLPEERIPMVVFITAFSDYSIDAFKKNALDYLLKPINSARFEEMLSRVKTSIHEKKDADFGRKLRSLLNLNSIKNYSRHLSVRTEDSINLVPVNNILYIKADGNYLTIHTKGEVHRFRETIKSIELKLDPEEFQRIHRSVIIHISEVRSLHHLYKGEYELRMSNADRLTSSRTYHAVIKKLISRPGV